MIKKIRGNRGRPEALDDGIVIIPVTTW